jgi:hypothetical protein
MPGYTKSELQAEGASLADFAYCSRCRRWWPKPGLKKHKTGCHGVRVKVVVGPLAKAPKEPVVVVENVEGFIDYLVERAFEAWERGELPVTMPEPQVEPAPSGLEAQRARLLKRRARLDQQIAKVESRMARSDSTPAKPR